MHIVGPADGSPARDATPLLGRVTSTRWSRRPRKGIGYFAAETIVLMVAVTPSATSTTTM